jgi:hypothetical protein
VDSHICIKECRLLQLVEAAPLGTVYAAPGLLLRLFEGIVRQILGSQFKLLINHGKWSIVGRDGQGYDLKMPV